MNLPPSKLLDLVALRAELVAAGVSVRGLGTFVRGPDLILHSYDAAGAILEQLPNGADTVVNAHIPPATPNYGATDGLDSRQKIINAVVSIRQYQGLAAGAVTAGQRKAYEDLIGDAVIALAKRVVGNG